MNGEANEPPPEPSGDGNQAVRRLIETPFSRLAREIGIDPIQPEPTCIADVHPETSPEFKQEISPNHLIWTIPLAIIWTYLAYKLYKRCRVQEKN